MSQVIETTRVRRRMLWMFGITLGAILPLGTSDLKTGFIPAVAMRTTEIVETACRTPDDGVTPGVKALAHDIARRFHLAQNAALLITHSAFSAASANGIDPTLVLAVAAVESRFKPGAVNASTGAKGLMQVLPRWHQDKLSQIGGEPSLLLISPNIHVGTAILAEYLNAVDGEVDDALGHYLGTAGAVNYTQRVRLEMAHLSKVLKRDPPLDASHG